MMESGNNAQGRLTIRDSPALMVNKLFKSA